MSEKLLDSSYQQRPTTFLFQHQHWRVLVCQCLGTAILVTGVCCTIYKNPVHQKQQNTIMMHDLFVILSLYMARCFFAPLTGGYFNTAVTFGVYLNKNSSNKITTKKFLVYAVAQLMGASIGAIISKVVYDTNTGPFLSSEQYSFDDILVRFVGEMIGSFYFIQKVSYESQQFRQILTFMTATAIFVHMILVLTTTDTTFIHEQCWVHLFVPIFLYGGRKISKYVDGLNPFELLALQVATSIFTEGGQSIHVVYVLILGVGQMIGGMLAALFFNWVYYPAIIKWRNQE